VHATRPINAKEAGQRRPLRTRTSSLPPRTRTTYLEQWAVSASSQAVAGLAAE